MAQLLDSIKRRGAVGAQAPELVEPCESKKIPDEKFREDDLVSVSTYLVRTWLIRKILAGTRNDVEQVTRIFAFKLLCFYFFVIVDLWLCLFREWQQRRVVITKDVISFAFVGEEDQIDFIPMAEIEFIKEMKTASVQLQSENTDVDNQQRLQIATIQEGYNSGTGSSCKIKASYPVSELRT